MQRGKKRRRNRKEEMIYEYFAVVAGKGESSQSMLNAFHAALDDAGAGHLNLIPVTSTLPKEATKIKDQEARKCLEKIKGGTLASCVLSRENAVAKYKIGAALAYGVDRARYGLVFEAHTFSDSKFLDELAAQAEAEARARLEEGAAISGLNLEKIFSKTSSLDIGQQYGCAVVALIYLPEKGCGIDMHGIDPTIQKARLRVPFSLNP